MMGQNTISRRVQQGDLVQFMEIRKKKKRRRMRRRVRKGKGREKGIKEEVEGET